jgi:hypothetical protein
MMHGTRDRGVYADVLHKLSQEDRYQWLRVLDPGALESGLRERFDAYELLARLYHESQGNATDPQRVDRLLMDIGTRQATLSAQVSATVKDVSRETLQEVVNQVCTTQQEHLTTQQEWTKQGLDAFSTKLETCGAAQREAWTVAVKAAVSTEVAPLCNELTQLRASNTHKDQADAQTRGDLHTSISAMTEATQLLRDTFGNSSRKGAASEKGLARFLEDRFPDHMVETNTGTHAGDIHLRPPERSGEMQEERVLVEAKAYTKTVDRDEVTKFYDDVDRTGFALGVFVAFGSAIVGKERLSVERRNDGWVCFIPHATFHLVEAAVLLLQRVYRFTTRSRRDVVSSEHLVERLRKALHHARAWAEKKAFYSDMADALGAQQKTLDKMRRLVECHEKETDQMLKQLQDEVEEQLQEAVDLQAASETAPLTSSEAIHTWARAQDCHSDVHGVLKRIAEWVIDKKLGVLPTKAKQCSFVREGVVLGTLKLNKKDVVVTSTDRTKTTLSARSCKVGGYLRQALLEGE